MLHTIKALIPNSLKYPFWWIFKSPQRALGWSTLIQDLKGLATYCFASKVPDVKLQPITICTGLLNRSDMYLDALVESVNHAKAQELITLSVFDCGSMDVPDLEKAIRSKWKGLLIFSKETRDFSRAYSFNKAVAQSPEGIIFICDADMSVPEDIVERCNRFTVGKNVWYPIVFYLFKGKPAEMKKENGHWMQYGGKGMLACHKTDFNKVGTLNETFTTWGKEDDELWERFMRAGYQVIRNRQKGLLHHWHESFNPKYKKLSKGPHVS